MPPFNETTLQIDHHATRFGYWLEITHNSFNPFKVLWAAPMMNWHIRRLEAAVDKMANELLVDGVLIDGE